MLPLLAVFEPNAGRPSSMGDAAALVTIGVDLFEGVLKDLIHPVLLKLKRICVRLPTTGLTTSLAESCSLTITDVTGDNLICFV
jgi:hypothetical protein